MCIDLLWKVSTAAVQRKLRTLRTRAFYLVFSESCFFSQFNFNPLKSTLLQGLTWPGFSSFYRNIEAIFCMEGLFLVPAPGLFSFGLLALSNSDVLGSLFYLLYYIMLY